MLIVPGPEGNPAAAGDAPASTSGRSRARRLIGWLGHALRPVIRDNRAVAALEFALLAVPMVLLFIAGAEMAQAVITSRNVESLAFTLVDLTSQQFTCPYQACATGGTDQPTSYNPQTSIQVSLLDSIMDASTAVLAGAPTTTLKMTLSAVDVVNDPATGQCCAFTVRWSYQRGGGTLRGGDCGAADTLTPVSNATAPAPTNIPNVLVPVAPALPANGKLGTATYEGVLISDVSYKYQPVFGGNKFIPTFAPTMTSTRIMFPREPGQVVLAGISAVKTPTQFTTATGSGQICY